MRQLETWPWLEFLPVGASPEQVMESFGCVADSSDEALSPVLTIDHLQHLLMKTEVMYSDHWMKQECPVPVSCNLPPWVQDGLLEQSEWH